MEKLIIKKTETNLYVVDTKGELIIGKPIFCIEGKSTFLCKKEHRYPENCFGFNKILYQLNPELPNIPLFTIIEQEVDVEKLAEKEYPVDLGYASFGAFKKTDSNERDRDIWKEGYNTHKELNIDRVFTKEDMIEFAKYQKEYEDNSTIDDNFLTWCLKKSLSTPDLDGREVEIEYQVIAGKGYGERVTNIPLLTPDGKVQVELKAR